MTKACVSWEGCEIFEGCSTGQNPHPTLGNAGDSVQDQFSLFERGQICPALAFPHPAVGQLRGTVIQCFESQMLMPATESEVSVWSKPSENI